MEIVAESGSAKSGGPNKECSMCGDVGFPDWLFECNKCRYRFQHRYCSKAYYEIGREECNVCDWCFVGDREVAGSKRSGVDSLWGNGLNLAGSASSKRKRLTVEQSGTRHHDGINSVTVGNNVECKSSNSKRRRRYRTLHEILC